MFNASDIVLPSVLYIVFLSSETKKFNSYLAVRQIRNENKAILLLTKNLSDLTIFKLSFLDEADKYELHFFEQLLWSFNNIINYFIEEKDSFSANSISGSLYAILICWSRSPFLMLYLLIQLAVRLLYKARPSFQHTTH